MPLQYFLERISKKKKISLICPIWRKLFTEEEEEEEIVRWGILQWCAGHLSFDLKKGHVSKFNFIFHHWICTVVPRYFRCVIFQNAFASSKVYIYENYFARGLTHQFSIDHHTLIHTQYTLKIPKKVHSFFFHLWVVPKFLCSKNNSVLPFLSF